MNCHAARDWVDISISDVVRVVAAGQRSQAAIRARKEKRAWSLWVWTQQLPGTGGDCHASGSDFSRRNSPFVVPCDYDVAAQRRHWRHIVGVRTHNALGHVAAGMTGGGQSPGAIDDVVINLLRRTQSGHALMQSAHWTPRHIQSGHASVGITGWMQPTSTSGVAQLRTASVPGKVEERLNKCLRLLL